jgi:hypothetical protein
MPALTLRTSDPDWFVHYREAYKSSQSGIFIDDANLGLSPDDFSLRKMHKVAVKQVEQRNLATASLTGGVIATIAVLAALAIYELVIGKRPPDVRVKIPGLEFEWTFKP